MAKHRQNRVPLSFIMKTTRRLIFDRIHHHYIPAVKKRVKAWLKQSN